MFHPTHPRRRGSHAVREQVQHQSEAGENILEHGDNLKCQDILSAIISDLEHSLLPDVVLGDFDTLGSRFVEHGVGIRAYLDLLLPNLESRHEGSLFNDR